MKSNEYWAKRLETIIYKREEVAVNGLEKELSKLYRQMDRKVQKRFKELYIELLEKGELSLSKLYEKKRLETFHKQINKELRALGKAEIKAMDDTLSEAYQLCYKEIAGEIGLEFARINKDVVKEVLHQAWSGDDFSDLVWQNKDKLLKKIDKVIKDTCILGYSHQKSTKELMHTLEVSRKDASRIVRTETMHVLNSATKNAAMDKGYKRYEFLAEIDSRTSEICKALDGKVFEFKDAHEGVNYPPLHPHCRSTVTIVIEDLL
ncbi:MAG: minor capsid protein [Sarcina sp.]